MQIHDGQIRRMDRPVPPDALFTTGAPALMSDALSCARVYNLSRALRLCSLVALVVVAAGCGNNDDDADIVGPDFPEGPGRVYNVESVTFSTVDQVRVSASYGRQPAAGAHPVVILVHEVGSSAASQEWLASRVFEFLLENGYNVLALDLRGHGGSNLPTDGRTQDVLLVSDLEDMHFEVRAGITWLRSQPSADNERMAVLGTGIGANVAYVAMGAYPEDLQAGIALSPGFWNNDLEPIVIGTGLDSFTPHTMLYIVGEADTVPISETESLSYAAFASALNSLTAEPRSLQIFGGVSSHGLALLQSPATSQLILDWLQTHL
jgi:pimeloyl-ACP methyl ester carboxylesterase